MGLDDDDGHADDDRVAAEVLECDGHAVVERVGKADLDADAHGDEERDAGVVFDAYAERDAERVETGLRERDGDAEGLAVEEEQGESDAPAVTVTKADNDRPTDTVGAPVSDPDALGVELTDDVAVGAGVSMAVMLNVPPPRLPEGDADAAADAEEAGESRVDAEGDPEAVGIAAAETMGDVLDDAAGLLVKLDARVPDEDSDALDEKLAAPLAAADLEGLPEGDSLRLAVAVGLCPTLLDGDSSAVGEAASDGDTKPVDDATRVELQQALGDSDAPGLLAGDTEALDEALTFPLALVEYELLCDAVGVVASDTLGARDTLPALEPLEL